MATPLTQELAQILSIQADKDIIDLYASLSERAKVYNFGLLEDDVVVIDTETTGLDFKECELIEVAAARLRGRDIIDTFDYFIKPSKPIPTEIVSLTGITNEMVEDAPDANTVVQKFIEFADGAPLIAHNAVFDRHFLKKANQGEQVGEVWIDSLELSRIVLPCLTSYKLHDLSRAFNLHNSTHRALDDVIATCGLWRILLVAASDLPAGLLYTFADLYPSTPWAYRHIFANMAALTEKEHFSLLDVRTQRCSNIELHAKEDAFELEEIHPLQYCSNEEIYSAFEKDGLVGRMYSSYEPRKEQVDMALAVAQAFEEHQKLAIEAGTGVGKSIAYLIPSVLCAQANNITVGIATKSNTLTDQIVNHELPLLAKTMQKELTYTALKGFDNYPCMRKVASYIRKGLIKNKDNTDTEQEYGSYEEPSEDLLNALAALCTFAVQSAQGDLNCLGIKWGKLQRSDFTSSSSECQKRHCSFFPNLCYLHLARKIAAASDIVVTNHSLLFRQIGSNIEVLPPIRYWIVDEAHSAEEEARKQWALTVNSREAAAYFEIMGNSHTGALGTLFKIAQTHPATTLILGLLTKASSECSRASIASGFFFDDLKTLCKKLMGKQSAYETTTLRLDTTLRSNPLFEKVKESGESFKNIVSKAIIATQDALKTITQESEERSSFDGVLEEASNALGSLIEMRDALDLILNGTNNKYVCAVSSTQRTGFEAYELSAQLLDIGEFLAKTWYPQVSSVVYSSATIAVAHKFDHFEHAVGLHKLPSGEHTSLLLDSGYDYQNNMGIIVVRDLPDPTKQKDLYLDSLQKLLCTIHTAMGGSVLTLFTSRVEMEQCYKAVSPILAQHGLELAYQDKASNVRRIRDHFIAEKTSSLFALKSFWEGFDAPGETLRCVVIPKLPFSAPTDPLSQERRDREGSGAWRNHDLPEAVISFKQAAGRLIRSNSDKGCLVLADPRLCTMWYGATFLQSLPHEANSVITASDIGSALMPWSSK